MSQIKSKAMNLQTLSEDTHSQLKKNVYQNYNQFIETAKEISFLESEMYQLSHMITEQRNLLTSLMDSSILGEKVSKIYSHRNDGLAKSVLLSWENHLNYHLSHSTQLMIIPPKSINITFTWQDWCGKHSHAYHYHIGIVSSIVVKTRIPGRRIRR